MVFFWDLAFPRILFCCNIMWRINWLVTKFLPYNLSSSELWWNCSLHFRDFIAFRMKTQINFSNRIHSNVSLLTVVKVLFFSVISMCMCIYIQKRKIYTHTHTDSRCSVSCCLYSPFSLKLIIYIVVSIFHYIYVALTAFFTLHFNSFVFLIYLHLHFFYCILLSWYFRLFFLCIFLPFLNSVCIFL